MLLAADLLALALPAAATNFNVGNQDQLADAINNAQNGDTITFTADITLNANLGQVQRNVTIDGNNHRLSGNNKYRGLYVTSGNVAINNLTIANALAQGGNGGDSYSLDDIIYYGSGGAGGGGAGLGGALFVAKGANVTVSNLKLLNDLARGGSGGTGVPPGSGKGRTSGGGGGLFGDGGNGGITQDGNGGAGGGGAGGGGNGGFGGGGGGTMEGQAGAGGFGGGGGGAGAGRDYLEGIGTAGAGGFGGSSGGITRGQGYGGGPGGSGAGMGGAIFVQEGGTLNLTGYLTVSGSAVAGGAGTGGRPNGAAYGSGIFLQGNGSFSLDPGAGQTQTISDAIADQTGVTSRGGSWSLVKNGAGTTVLTGANHYSGGTTVNTGILQGDTQGLQGNIVNNAVLVFDQAGNGTYAGSISGSGSLTKLGAGTVTLTGKNTYSGSTTVNGGTLQGNTGSMRGNILLHSKADNPIAVSVIFNQLVDGTYAGVISGNGSLTKIGSGKLSLPGVQTFTGATNIDAGNLNVNGSLESSGVVNVNPGATLSGNGKFGNVNNNGGTISPGNSIGTVHIDGDLTMAPDSTYYVQINGDTSDLIQVSGTANIQSSTIEIAHDSNSAAAPVVPGKTYTMLTTGNGLTTTPFLLGVADFPFIAFHAIAGADNGYLTTSRGPDPFSSLASTANEKAVANGLDSLPATNLLWRQVVGATTAQAQAAFTSLGSASFHANITAALSTQSLYVRDAVLDRLRQGVAANTAAVDTASTVGQAVVTHGDSPAAVWVRLLGSQGTLAGNANAASIDDTLGGGLIGVDATVNQWRLGMAGGYTHPTFNSAALPASGDSRSYHLAFYGGTQLGDWGLRGGASFAWNDVTTSRSAGAVNVGGMQSGDYLDKTRQAFIEAGRHIAFASGSLEPFANLAYVHVQGNVRETGAAAVDGSSKLATTYSTLGLHGTAASTPRLTIRGTLGWQHAMGDVTPVATLSFAPGSMPFDLAGSPIARDALVAAASFNYAVSAHASLGLGWTGQIANHNHDNAVQGLFNWQF